ncbi:MAG TPA: ABC transporter permease [Thermoplasmata archaeon]|nr:ABC transporter permease [Thermoplasmata archaeon]
MSTAVAAPKTLADTEEGRAVPAFAIIGWRWISRNPAATVAPILTPFIFLYFLGIISPGTFPFEVLGAMMFTTQNIGNWVLGDSATWRLHTAIQDLFVASPLGKVRYLFGIALSNLIPAAPALVILGVVLAVVTPVPFVFWLLLIGALAVIWVLFSAIGIAISSRVRSQREIWPVGTLIFTVVGMLSPLYYPLNALPPLWRDAALFLPSTYAALLLRGALVPGTLTDATMALYGVLLVASAVVGTVLALRLYRWKTP